MALAALIAVPAVANPVIVVTSTANSGAHTLRHTIAHANSTPGPDRIEFHLGGAGHATITVQRVGGSEGAVTVRYATSDGSAKAPADYTAWAGTLHLAAGQTSGTFNVPIVNDTRHEPTERFTVHLSDPGAGAALGTPTSARVTIRASD